MVPHRRGIPSLYTPEPPSSTSLLNLRAYLIGGPDFKGSRIPEPCTWTATLAAITRNAAKAKRTFASLHAFRCLTQIPDRGSQRHHVFPAFNSLASEPATPAAAWNELAGGRPRVQDNPRSTRYQAQGTERAYRDRYPAT